MYLSSLHRESRRTLSPFMTTLAMGICLFVVSTASAQSVQFRTGLPLQEVTVRAEMFRPSGNGPFPAVIILHTCGGVGIKESQYGRGLRDEGYVVVVPDSFASRGNTRKGYRCVSGNYDTHVRDSVSDALGAAAYLGSQPFVRRDRVAIMGMSLGGTAVLSLPPESSDHGIRAGISFYPPCVLPDGKHFFTESRIPLLLLLGDLDNWSSTPDCVRKAQEIQKSGRTLDWIVYPKTHHGFDNQTYRSASNDGRGRTMEFNQKAADDSWERSNAFLAKHLGKEP